MHSAKLDGNYQTGSYFRLHVYMYVLYFNWDQQQVGFNFKSNIYKEIHEGSMNLEIFPTKKLLFVP